MWASEHVESRIDQRLHHYQHQDYWGLNTQLTHKPREPTLTTSTPLSRVQNHVESPTDRLLHYHQQKELLHFEHTSTSSSSSGKHVERLTDKGYIIVNRQGT